MQQGPHNFGHGYGPQTAQQSHQQGYGYPYPHGAQPPAKKSLGVGMIALIVGGCLFGGCMLLGAVASTTSARANAPAKAGAQVDPAEQAAKLAAAQKAEADAKAAKEKLAVESFPEKKTAIEASLKKASAAAAGNKWAAADADLSVAEAALAEFKGTSVEQSGPFEELTRKSGAVRAKIAAPLAKIAEAERRAADEKALKASSVSVSSAELFNAYQANEVAADNRFKGQKLLVTGTVASIDKDFLGGLVLRLSIPNEFMSTMCSMHKSDASSLAQLSKGESVRVLCTGGGMTIGSPSLRDCTFR